MVDAIEKYQLLYAVETDELVIAPDWHDGYILIELEDGFLDIPIDTFDALVAEGKLVSLGDL